jgi:hypothetical protein
MVDGSRLETIAGKRHGLVAKLRQLGFLTRHANAGKSAAPGETRGGAVMIREPRPPAFGFHETDELPECSTEKVVASGVGP